MSAAKDDEFAGQGGRYEMRDGKRVRIEESTSDHPDGNTARDAQGNVIVHASSERIAAREKAAATGAAPAQRSAAPQTPAPATADVPDFLNRKKGAN